MCRGGALDADALTKAVAGEFGLAVVHLDSLSISPEVLGLVPRTFVQEHRVMPFAREDGVLHVAVVDPLAVEAFDRLAYATGLQVAPALASRESVSRAMLRHYGREAGSSEPGASAIAAAEPPLAADFTTASDGGVGEESQPGENDAPINQLVQGIIADAVRSRASDIHLEPLGRTFRVRCRIDGVLAEVSAPPRRLQAAIISRLKIMANISIAEKRLPQDGRIRIAAAGRTLDLRVSSLPTVHGESIVMRVLDEEGLKPGLPELGLMPEERLQFERLIDSSDGMVLVTGPTGSGKTTTLYSCLHRLNRTARKIITVEEPVEYQLSGINQVPVNAAIGMTFASALRAMLRQAPNVVMVGEIRDRETADIAINASLTGHLVLSTLHTNDAPSAVTRLIDIGAKPFLVAAALRASVAQRLVRRNCPHCRVAWAPSGAELQLLNATPSLLAGATFMRGRGCDACHGTGFLGRIGIFEIFLVNDEIRALICGRATGSRLRREARRSGFGTMREDGIRKVLAGHTTIAEVMAVTVGDEP